MPKLTDAERESIDARYDIHERIRAEFDAPGRQWTSQHCYLCNYASNGHDFDEAIAADAAHIQAEHAAEDAEMQATTISVREARASIHDHDCELRVCVCLCGHGESSGDTLGCILVFGLLCGYCTVRAGRGDRDHGEKVGEE